MPPRLLRALLAGALVVLVAGVGSALAADPLSRIEVAPHAAGERLGHFRDAVGGATFVARGTNYVRLAQLPNGTVYHSLFEPGQYDPGRTEAALSAMQRDGYDTVRVFTDAGSIPDAQEGYPHGMGRGVSDFGTVYGPYLDNVADFIRRADAHCIRVIINLDGFPANSHYYTQVPDRPISKDIEGQNLWYLDTAHVQAKRAFLIDFVGGLRARLGAARLSAVFAYQISNEAFIYGNAKPFSQLGPHFVTTANGGTYDMTSGGLDGGRQRAMDDNLSNYANVMATAIRGVDPRAMVTMGAFTYAAVGKRGPDGLTLNCEGAGCPAYDYRYPVRPALLARDTTLSFLDLHTYPAPQPGVNDPYTAQGDLNTSEWPAIAGKPVVIGEFGALKSYWSNDLTRAALGMRDLQVTECKLGVAGSLFWTFDTHEPYANQNLFFMNDERVGAINGQLAPIARPNMCDAKVVSPYGPATSCHRVPEPPATPQAPPASGPRRRSRLAVARAKLSGAGHRTLALAGTLRAGASDFVTVRVGRGAGTVSARAAVRRGGFSLRRRLPRRLVRGGTARVVVTSAGDATAAGGRVTLLAGTRAPRLRLTRLTFDARSRRLSLRGRIAAHGRVVVQVSPDDSGQPAGKASRVAIRKGRFSWRGAIGVHPSAALVSVTFAGSRRARVGGATVSRPVA